MTNRDTTTTINPRDLCVHGHAVAAAVEDLGAPYVLVVSPTGDEWVTVPDYAEAVLRERVSSDLSEWGTIARAAEVLNDLAVDGEGVYLPGEAPYQKWPAGWAVVHTGGGCRHAQVSIPGGGEVLACDGEGVAPRVGEPWTLGVYDADGSPVDFRTVDRLPTPAEARAWGAEVLRSQ